MGVSFWEAGCLRDDTHSTTAPSKEGKGERRDRHDTADEEQEEPGADQDKLEKGAGRPGGL